MDSLIRMPRSLVGLTFSGITVVEPPVVLDDHIRYFFRGVDKYRGETMSDDDKQKIGDAGEEAVLRFEIARLRHFGREDLAKKVSKAQREDRSYDIDSFDLDEQRIFIEVKTTQRVGTFPFFLRRPQLAACKLQPENYRLYRLFEFGESTKMYILSGLQLIDCKLEPIVCWGWPRKTSQEKSADAQILSCCNSCGAQSSFGGAPV